MRSEVSSCFILLRSDWFPDSINYRLDLQGRQAGPFYCNSTSNYVHVVTQDYTDPASGNTFHRVRQGLGSRKRSSTLSCRLDGLDLRGVILSSIGGLSRREWRLHRFSGSPFVTYTISSGGNNNSWNCNVTRTEGSWTTTASIRSTQDQETVTLQKRWGRALFGLCANMQWSQL